MHSSEHICVYIIAERIYSLLVRLSFLRCLCKFQYDCSGVCESNVDQPVWHCTLWVVVLWIIIRRRCPWRCVCCTSYMRCNMPFLRVTDISPNYAQTLLKSENFTYSVITNCTRFLKHPVLTLQSGAAHWKCNHSLSGDDSLHVFNRYFMPNFDRVAIEALIFCYLNDTQFMLSTHYSNNLKKLGLHKKFNPVSSTSYIAFL